MTSIHDSKSDQMPSLRRTMNRTCWPIGRRFRSVGLLVVIFLVVLKVTLLDQSALESNDSSHQTVEKMDSLKISDNKFSNFQVHVERDSGDHLSNPFGTKGESHNDLHIEVNENTMASENGVTKHDVINSIEKDIQLRNQAYTQWCSIRNRSSMSYDIGSFIVADPNFKMAYCFVAKIACTFWLRIFSFLTRPDDMQSLGIISPSKINRAALHSGHLMPKPLLSLRGLQTSSDDNTLKFLFARNPYERLWSVYLDKYYLPDYWVTFPLGDSRCGVNTTFNQFLNNAITSKDHHLTPVSQACNPCNYKPNVVGKMETFTRDAKYILNQTGYGHLLENYDHLSYVEIEMTSLIVYNFNLLTSHGLTKSRCLNPKSLSRRLWRVFQINGHLKSNSLFPDEQSDYSMQNVLDVFLSKAKDDPISKEQSRKQRRDAIVEAYSKIPPSLIEGIRLRYQTDFNMFDYSSLPPA